MTPAESLKGINLGNGWTVEDRLTKPITATGGRFSVGYTVVSSSGKRAFLKALDFSGALSAPDPARELQTLTENFNFERDVLAKCKSHGLDRVLLPIVDGKVTVPGFGPFGTVMYIIFELAEGDIRSKIARLGDFSLAWRLRSLHHTAVGIMQLHSREIAHQDIKPSNVLVFGGSGARIADLGRASDRSTPFWIDKLPIAGDKGYAPLDLYYTGLCQSDFELRRSCDVYLLGSLIFFHFSGVSAVHALRTKLLGPTPVHLSGNFQNDLPHLQYAFYETLKDLRHEVQSVAGVLADDIVAIAKELCEPDPRKRGYKSSPTAVTSSYDLSRYVSKFNLLARKAEMGLI